MGETGIVLGVSHHDDRGPFPVQFGEQLHHFGSVLRVQVTGRLIGEDDLRIRNDSTCDGHTLLLSSGKLLREMARAVADVHPFQDIVHHLLTLAGFYFQVGKREFHVFEHVQFVDQVETLEHETDVAFADLRTLLLLEMPDFLACQVIIARSRIVQQPQDIQQCRFATSGRSHDSHKLAIFHFQGNIIQCNRLYLFRTEKLT